MLTPLEQIRDIAKNALTLAGLQGVDGFDEQQYQTLLSAMKEILSLTERTD